MANRNQDYSNRSGSQSGSRRTSQDWREEDDNSNEENRGQFGGSRGRDTNEQSGSTGRYAGYGDFGRGDYGGGRSGWSGQERYGQSGYGQGSYGTGGSGRGGSEQGDYGRGRSEESYGSRSNYGYGGGSGGRGQYGQGGQGGRSWSEPYGEGQQYSSSGNYGGERSGFGEDWNRQQRFGGSQGGQGYFTGESSGQGYASQGYGYGGQQDYRGGSGMSGGMGGMGGVGYAGQGYGYGSQGYGSQGYGSQGMGEHRGKGPKGYQRSDERLKEMVCERLREDPQIDPSEVTITVQGGKITLEGTVDSRQTKNSIEEIAEQCGVQDVQNNLRVQRSQPGSQSSMETGKQGKGAGEDNAASKLKQH
jgi:osmotically-inducible protein OsmY